MVERTEAIAPCMLSLFCNCSDVHQSSRRVIAVIRFAKQNHCWQQEMRIVMRKDSSNQKTKENGFSLEVVQAKESLSGFVVACNHRP
jgi:hypothetical protein